MATKMSAGPKGVVLFERWMDLTQWLLERTARWPKRLRHSLTERVELLTLGVLEDITTASYAKDKRVALERAQDRLNRLRMLLRLGHQLHVLSHAQYEHAATQLVDCGRQLGGWLRHTGAAATAAP